MLLLVASCYFYMQFVPVYILILAFTIIIDYFAGIYIERASGKNRKILLVISLLSNIGVLALFKYYNFLNENLSFLLGSFGSKNPLPFLEILLPIGLSFHTFQAMSYTIEIYRGKQTAEKHFGIYALYVMFYPQLVAGPIERPQNLIHQFHAVHHFDYGRAVSGLRQMLWGFFKKIVVADRLAVYVNEVYNNPANYHGMPVLMASYFFAIQIYCDFSGYSDIAIGAARVMGFDLMQNFNLPYFAKSVKEFWNRWHISLSTWFKDYVYIPLGGSRVSEPRWMLNLLIVFAISGLWHGANWTFIIWGLLHGIFIVSEILLQKLPAVSRFTRTSFGKFAGIVVTFHCVVLGWIFFRAKSVEDAFQLIENMLNFDFSKLGVNISLNYGNALLDKVEVVLCFLVIAFLFIIDFRMRKIKFSEGLQKLNLPLRWLVYYFFVSAIILLGNYSNKSDFIYFQF
jgi:alginate O-acetyltransferase complex protein AlgI